MQQLLEFIPLVIFFTIYKTCDIYTATASLIITSLIQLIYMWYKHKKIEKMQLVTTAMILVFGGLTIFTKNADFIKWKVTLVYSIFALILLVSQFLKKPVIKNILGKEFNLPNITWNKINSAWAVFFIICAITNTYVAFNMPQDIWVDFKVFGLFGFTIIYTILTIVYIYKKHPSSLKNQNN